MRTIGLALLLMAAPTFAAELRSGEQIVVRDGEVIDDDLYAFGQTIRIEGEVRGDLVAFGRDVIIPGRVAGDLISASKTLRLTGSVGGSVRSAAQGVFVDGMVEEDALAAAADVRLGTGARVGHDLLAAGGHISLDAPVGGNALLRTQSLEVGSSASVQGVLQYAATRPASISPGAALGMVEQLPAPRRPPKVAWFILSWLRLAVGLFALGLAVSWVAPKLTLSARGMLKHTPWKSLGIGVLAFIALPVCASLLFVVGALIGGWWLGLVALGAMAIAIALAFPIVGLQVGDWLLRNPGHERAELMLALAVGVPLLALLVRVPIVGGLAAVAAMLFGVGALLLAAWHLRRVPVLP